MALTNSPDFFPSPLHSLREQNTSQFDIQPLFRTLYLQPRTLPTFRLHCEFKKAVYTVLLHVARFLMNNNRKLSNSPFDTPLGKVSMIVLFTAI